MIPHVVAALAMTLAVLGPSWSAAQSLEDRCQALKMRAAGRLTSCRAEKAARAMVGKPSDPAACDVAFREALDRIDERARKSGTSCRLRDLGDGTMLDLDTGLQWERKTNLDDVKDATNPHDGDNTYTWTHQPGLTIDDDLTLTVPNGTAFTGFLGRLNDCATDSGGAVVLSTGFAGHCDWRLPTLAELMALATETTGCGLSTRCFDVRLGWRVNTSYWTLTSGEIPTNAWEVQWNGDPYVDDESSKRGGREVRAVRGGW